MQQKQCALQTKTKKTANPRIEDNKKNLERRFQKSNKLRTQRRFRRWRHVLVWKSTIESQTQITQIFICTVWLAYICMTMNEHECSTNICWTEPHMAHSLACAFVRFEFDRKHLKYDRYKTAALFSDLGIENIWHRVGNAWLAMLQRSIQRLIGAVLWRSVLIFVVYGEFSRYYSVPTWDNRYPTVQRGYNIALQVIVFFWEIVKIS